MIAPFVLLYPNRWLSAWSQLSDIPYSLPYGLAFACAIMVISGTGGKRHAAATGIFGGVSALIRNDGLLLALPLFGGPALTAGTPGDRLTRVGIAVEGMAIVLTPWIIRHYILLGMIVPVSTNSGYNLLIGNNEGDRVVWNNYADTLFVHRGNGTWGETSRDSFYIAQALEYMAQHPGQAVLSGSKKQSAPLPLTHSQ